MLIEENNNKVLLITTSCIKITVCSLTYYMLILYLDKSNKVYIGK